MPFLSRKPLARVWYNPYRRFSKELESIAKARLIAEAVSQKQGSDILLLDTREYCGFADYFVICTSESTRQTEAIGEEIGKVMKEQGDSVLAREGGNNSGWLLLDLGDVIVHIFGATEREFYQLEKLWEKAPVILRIQ